MRKTYYIMSVAAMAVAALCSCSMSDADLSAAGGNEYEGEGMVEVSVSLPSLATRTSVGSDDGRELTPEWSDGDRFNMYIGDGDGTISGPYTFTHIENSHDERNNIFMGRIPVLPDGEYTYYGVYPAPAMSFAPEDLEDDFFGVTSGTVEGGVVDCTVPAVQSGRYDDGADVMWAATTGGVLSPTLFNRLDLKFEHLTHALKITVPESKNLFGDSPIDRVTVEFPADVAVAGYGSLNLNDITPSAERGDESRPGMNTAGMKYHKVEIRFDEPLKSGESFWVHVAPVDLTGKSVGFRAYCDAEGACMMSGKVSTTAFGVLEPQHITPVTIPVTEAVAVTWFEYEILHDESLRLGENLSSVNLMVPSGFQAADMDEVTQDGDLVKVQKDGLGVYRVAFLTETVTGDALDFRPKYESEHALLSPYSEDAEKFVFDAGGYKVGGFNSFRLGYVPYLFEEDFSNMVEFASAGDNPTGNFSTTTTAESLDEYNLQGWSAARGGGEAGTAIRICGRTEDGLLSIAHYHGRLDSCPLGNIKEEVSVNVSVSFNYSVDINKSISHTPRIAYGYHTTQGVINSKGTTRGDATPGLENPVVRDLTAPLGGSYTNINEYASYEIPGCTNAHRLAWEIYTSGRQTGNSNSWLYIDNVRVSIAE